MSKASELQDILKSLPVSGSWTGQNLLVFDSNGTPSRVVSKAANLVELANKESPNTIMDLKDFTMKYIEGLVAGMWVSDTDHSIARKWFLKLKDGLELNLQHYMILVTTVVGSISREYGYVSFIMFPTISGNKIYHVYQYTDSSADKYKCNIYALDMVKL